MNIEDVRTLKPVSDEAMIAMIAEAIRDNKVYIKSWQQEDGGYYTVTYAAVEDTASFQNLRMMDQQWITTEAVCKWIESYYHKLYGQLRTILVERDPAAAESMLNKAIEGTKS